MPKINVYLPDDLAAAVRAADVPVSAVCQRALADAVQIVQKVRKSVTALRNPQFDPDSHPQFATRLVSRMTATAFKPSPWPGTHRPPHTSSRHGTCSSGSWTSTTTWQSDCSRLSAKTWT